MSVGFVWWTLEHAELRRPAAAVKMQVMMPRVKAPKHRRPA
jgi:hypothetical protein